MHSEIQIDGTNDKRDKSFHCRLCSAKGGKNERKERKRPKLNCELSQSNSKYFIKLMLIKINLSLHTFPAHPSLPFPALCCFTKCCD